MSDRSIREAVAFLAGTHQTDQVTLFDATVDSVDMGTRTCICVATSGAVGSIIPDVRLMSSVDDGILILPAKDSSVTIALSIFTGPVLICYSEIDKIIWRGGEFGGLVKAPSLTDKLNNIENLLNDLIIKFNTHTHNVTATGVPTGPNLLPENTTLTTTERTDIENEAITHG